MAALTLAFLPDIAGSSDSITVDLDNPQLYENDRENVLGGWLPGADADRLPWPYCRIVQAALPDHTEPITVERAHVELHRPTSLDAVRVTLRWDT
jgi:hypothetical protein